MSVYVIAIALIVSSIASVFFNSVSGTGNTKSALILELGVLALYVVHICLTGMYYKFPVHICLTAEILYFVGLFVGSALYLRHADWKNKKI